MKKNAIDEIIDENSELTIFWRKIRIKQFSTKNWNATDQNKKKIDKNHQNRSEPSYPPSVEIFNLNHIQISNLPKIKQKKKATSNKTFNIVISQK